MTGHDYAEIRRRVARLNSRLRKAHPDTIQAFRDLDAAASKDGALDPATKELIALAIAVSQGCVACIAFHTHAALKHGATPDQILEMLSVTVVMGGGPSLMYAANVIEAMEQELGDSD